MKRALPILIFSFMVIQFTAGSVFISAQELKKMRVTEVPEAEQKPVVVTEPNEALLVVYSTIDNLSFTSSPTDVIRVENRSTGFYLVHLSPGTNMVSISAPGYATAMERIPIPRKESRQYRVEPEIQTLEGPRGKVELELGSIESVFLISDGLSVGDFPVPATGIMRLTFSAGQHTIKIMDRKGNREFTHTFNLVEGQVLRLPVQFKASSGAAGMLTSQFGVLSVKSHPSGATVSLDGLEAGQTPYVKSQIPVGEHTVVIEKMLYKSSLRQVSIQSGELSTIADTLVPAFGRLNITSEPTDAEVAVDGISWGRTPLVKDSIQSRTYTVRISKDLYLSYDTPVQVQDGKESKVHGRLNPNFGTLDLNSTPDSSPVFLNNKAESEGVTPLILKVEPGIYSLEIRNDYFRPFKADQVVEAGRTYPINAVLERLIGTITITSRPSDAEISLDGKMLGLTPVMIKEHPAGEYQLEARWSGRPSQKQNLTLRPGTNDPLEIVLGTSSPSSTATMAQGTKPDLNRSVLTKKHKKTWPWLVAGGAIVAGGVAYAVLSKKGRGSDKAPAGPSPGSGSGTLVISVPNPP